MQVMSGTDEPDQIPTPVSPPLAWLPPFKTELFRIQPPPVPSDFRSDSARTDAREPFLSHGSRSARSAFERRKILAKGVLHHTNAFAQFRNRSARPPGAIPGSPRCPGALGWLYREPENDARRLESWIRSCPEPERGLRKELRTPVTLQHPSPREFLAGRSEQLDVCLKEVARYRPENAPVMEAGRRRHFRLKQMGELEAARIAEESQEELNKRADGSNTEIPNESARDIGGVDETEMPMLDTDVERDTLQGQTSMSARSRSCRDSTDGLKFSELVSLCQANPFTTSATVAEIATFAMQHAASEEQRAWVAFCWVCYHVRFDADRRAAMSAEHVLGQRSAGAWGFAKLFGAICAAVRLTAKVVKGHRRNFPSLPGDDIRADDCNWHWWNAVFLNKTQWILVDCALGAAKRKGRELCHFQPYFFGPAPEDLAFSHFPVDPHWQILPEPLSYEDFVSQVSVRPDAFTESNLEFWPQRRPEGTLGLTRTNIGCVTLRTITGQSLQASLDGDPSRCFVTAKGSVKMKLKITIVGANSLRNADACDGKYELSDPYCVCEVPGKRHLAFKTDVAMNKLEPVWNQIFELDDLEPGDELKFGVFDKDSIGNDDVLGRVTLMIGSFCFGNSFEGEVGLESDGAMNSTLTLQIEPVFKPMPSSGEPLTDVFFCVPQGSGKHRLEIFSCSMGFRKSPRPVCLFNVLAPAEPLECIDCCFPQIPPGALRHFGIAFREIWPNGHHVLGERNVIEISLHKLWPSQGLEVVVDVDGERRCALTCIFDDLISIRAQVPPGDHVLNVLARRDSQTKFISVVTYKVHVPDNCNNIFTDGFPYAYDTLQEVGAALEAPLSGCLQTGSHNFRLRLPPSDGDQQVAVSHSGAKDPVFISKRDGGVFQGDVDIRGKEAVLLHGNSETGMQPLLRWKVQGTPTTTQTNSRRPSKRF